MLQSATKRVNDALYELDSPMQAGNQNSSSGYVLSTIEKASASATEFATAFNNFVADGPNGDQPEVIKHAHGFASSVADVLSNVKGLTRLFATDSQIDSATTAARDSAVKTVNFFEGVLSSRLQNLDSESMTERVISHNLEVQRSLQILTRTIERTDQRGKRGIQQYTVEIGDLVDQELKNAASTILEASQKLAQLVATPMDSESSLKELDVNQNILESALAVTNAIAQLIKSATESQNEIVAQGKGNQSKTAFYRRNSRWTEGLVSAAKAVAASTRVLIETADGVVRGTNIPEQLIVASNEVAASTAQLVAASRVKASFMSSTQERLESASKTVNRACRSLVRRVQEVVARQNEHDEDAEDFELSLHDFKVKEMEQQVEILKLENDLSVARRRLGEMRKFAYKEDVGALQ